MERTFNRYIWKHSYRQQIWIICVVLLSMIPFYFAFELPKMLINGPIQGGGFEEAGAKQPFLPDYFQDAYQLDRIDMLMALSMVFLTLVVVNGLFKYYINTFKGLLGERLLRRLRYELLDRILRFTPVEFRRIKGGEISSMVKDEVEQLGGFASEAYVQPLLLSGQAITALGFIFVQNVGLGLLALFMVGIQMVLIPRLRQRLLILGRERQISARQLAGRITEVVDGIETVHAFHTSNYERADIASRLATLFRIRYQIYTRKYKIKFLNNFLAQITPFLFYLVGGYLAITGRLDVGQLVAVIAAYKELPGPLKALIDWDLAKQDAEIKYDQILEQFDVDELIDAKDQSFEAPGSVVSIPAIAASNITTEDFNGGITLDDVSISVAKGETLALIGGSNSGANIFTEVLGGITKPVQGKILAGDQPLASLPESVRGEQISYVSADTYFFYGTVEKNLLYGLMHRPVEAMTYTESEAAVRQWEVVEAKRTANPVLDLKANWIDPKQVTGLNENANMIEAMRKVLDSVEFSDDVLNFAFHSKVSSVIDPELDKRIVDLRAAIQDELREKSLSNLVIPFDADGFNEQATLLDNVLFGILTDPEDSKRYADVSDFLHVTLKDTGLGDQLVQMGIKIAGILNELFQDLPEDHPHFENFDIIDSAELPTYRELYVRSEGKSVQEIDADDRLFWINLSFKYSEPLYRFGLTDDTLKEKVLSTRKLLHESMPEDLKGGIEVYDPDKVLASVNLLDNIVFGKLNQKIKNSEQKIRDVIAPMLDEQTELFNDIYSIGLNFNVGPSGRRLTSVQRQKLNLARAIMRKTDYYIFNRPVSGLDHSQQQRIITKILALFDEQKQSPGVVWALATEANAAYFQRAISFDGNAISHEAEPVLA